MIALIEAATESEFSTGRMLFEEYAAALRIDLCFQGFGSELEHIREMYGSPHGCLILAVRTAGLSAVLVFVDVT